MKERQTQLIKLEAYNNGENVSFHSNPKERQAKECSYYHSIELISYASKGMLKLLQARLQQFVKQELPDVQAGLRKGRGTRQ